MDDAPKIPRYRILRVLGEGGMGIVYEAEQLEPVKRRVALKLLKVGMDTKAFLGRFEGERQALAVMEHPCIATIYDAGATAEGRPYYTMEFVGGVPITEFADTNRLDTKQRVALMAEVCRAMHHAHEKGIIHRDLKPSNVLISLHGERATPKVIDFGIAKAMTGRLADRTYATELHQPIGTPAYMSPEQWEAGLLELDGRADVYSLGVIFYELLVGRLPYDSGALARAGAAASLILRDTPMPSPSTRLDSLGRDTPTIARFRNTDARALKRELRGDLDRIVMKALEPDRIQRYESAGAFADDLQRFLRSEPIAARPPSVPYRVARFTRRNRAAVIGASVIAVLLLVGAVMTERSRRTASVIKDMQSDLRWLVTTEEGFFSDSDHYTRDLSKLKDLHLHPGVAVEFLTFTRGSYVAAVRHAEYPGIRCAVAINELNPLGGEGEPICVGR